MWWSRSPGSEAHGAATSILCLVWGAQPYLILYAHLCMQTWRLDKYELHNNANTRIQDHTNVEARQAFTDLQMTSDLEVFSDALGAVELGLVQPEAQAAGELHGYRGGLSLWPKQCFLMFFEGSKWMRGWLSSSICCLSEALSPWSRPAGLERPSVVWQNEHLQLFWKPPGWSVGAQGKDRASIEHWLQAAASKSCLKAL